MGNPTNPTTLTQVAPVNNWYDGVLLDRLLPFLPHRKYGQMRPVDLHKGQTTTFRRYNSLPAQLAPLLEGVMPTALRTSITTVTGKVEHYGAYTEITEECDFFNEDPVLTEYAELLGENAQDSIDQIDRDKLNAGTSVFRGGAVALRSSIITKATAAELLKIRRTLAGLNVKPFKERINPTTAVSTTGVRPGYICLIHPDVTYDIESLGAGVFLPVSQYPNPAMAEEGEIGSVGYFRFIETSNAKIWIDTGGAVGATGCKSTGGVNLDIYSILILGQNAYGQTDLRGNAMRTITKSKEQIGGPLEQFGTMGWSGYTDLVILDDLRMMRYEVAVSA